MKRLVIASLALALTLALVLGATRNEEAPRLAATEPPLTPVVTGADVSVTDPEPVGDIGTALVITCKPDGRCLEREFGEGLVKVNGLGAEAWHWRALKAEKRVERLLETKQRLLAQVARTLAPTAQEEYAIHLASIAYQQPERDMLRVAGCESNLYAGSRNETPIYNGEHATGLFQFIPSTWASTPYGHLNIYEPVANALATGWMWTVGRRSEWACR